jgi:predicted Zn-dependent protease
MTRNGRWIRTAVLTVAIGGMLGCATNPVTGRNEVSFVSQGQELQMGQEGYKAVVQEYGLYDGQDLQAYVNMVGQKVAKVSHLPNLDWHFTLLDDATVNAFAMPGGYIYVTRGILSHLNSEAQLAGVLGHEVGHVTHRHTAERITQQQLYGLGFGLASVFSPTFAQYSNVAQQALGLLFLKYSRQDETEADQLGVEYSTKAGYDPREIPATYAMLKRVSEQSGSTLPAFLSTHPDPGAREETTTQLANQAAAGKTGLLINERVYVQHLDGIVYGNDPRQGYFAGDQYYHPSLRFQLAFPSGWKHQDSKSSVVAAEANQAGAMQLTLTDAGGQSPSQFVAALSAKGSISGANGGSETVGGWPAWLGRLTVPQQNQAATTLDAAFVRKDQTQMFQILGQSKAPGDAAESSIFASMRSLRPLTDPARINVTADIVRVSRVATSGSFSTVAASLGEPANLLTEGSIINNVQPDEGVAAGTLIKTIVPGHH